MTDISGKIANFIKTEIMHDSEAELAHDRLLLDEGIVDSLGLQQLVTFVEEEFDIMVDDEYLLPEYFECVQALTDLVKNLKG